MAMWRKRRGARPGRRGALKEEAGHHEEEEEEEEHVVLHYLKLKYSTHAIGHSRELMF